MRIKMRARAALASALLGGATSWLAWSGGASALLDRVPLPATLTFYGGRESSHRRVPAVPHLKCVGGDACAHSHHVRVVQCQKTGVSFDNEPQWQCTEPNLPPQYKLGETTPVCEGYHSADDAFFLRNSCGLEYTLHHAVPAADAGRHHAAKGNAPWTTASRWGLAVLAAVVACFLELHTPLGWVFGAWAVSYIPGPVMLLLVMLLMLVMLVMLVSACGGGGGRAAATRQYGGGGSAGDDHYGSARRQSPGHGVDPSSGSFWGGMAAGAAANSAWNSRPSASGRNTASVRPAGSTGFGGTRKR
jgi:hypothetical protein